MSRQIINKRIFYQSTGRAPEQDDLERCNCDKAGDIGHQLCGWCKHNRPLFECIECAHERVLGGADDYG